MPIAFEASPEISIFIIAPERNYAEEKTIHNLIFENGTPGSFPGQVSEEISGQLFEKNGSNMLLVADSRVGERDAEHGTKCPPGPPALPQQRGGRRPACAESPPPRGSPPADPKEKEGGISVGICPPLCAKAHRGDRFRPVRVSYGISSGARSYPAARGVSSPGPPAGIPPGRPPADPALRPCPAEGRRPGTAAR